VANLGNTVSVIDTATYNVIATMNTFVSPDGRTVETPEVAVNPDGTKAYVACAYNIVGLNGVISVIDIATDKVIANVTVGAWPNDVEFSPDGKKAYVPNEDSNTVSVINTATNTVTATVNGLNSPGKVAVTPDGKKIYVLNIGNTISLIDTTTNTVVATLNIMNDHSGIAFTPDGKKVYVTNDNNVSVIDTETNTVIANLIVGNTPQGVAVTPDGKKAYVTNYFSNDVSVIDTATNRVTATVNVGTNPSAIGQFIYLPVQQLLPVANFTINVSSGYAPLIVQFNDSSENATGWSWDFGDRTTSMEPSPMHIYGAGNYTVDLTVSNPNGIDSKLATINVSKSVPTIIWNTSANVSYGTALSDTQLNASASVPGTFNYTPPAGTILNAGTQKLSVDFTPKDTTNYTNASKNVTINFLQSTVPTFPGYSNPPTDPNHDGLFEDINGNGRMDFADVVTYYNNMAWITQKSLTAYYDYNDNGRIDFNDVVKLYNMH
jgi:YVTN family beta-propeller protein